MVELRASHSKPSPRRRFLAVGAAVAVACVALTACGRGGSGAGTASSSAGASAAAVKQYSIVLASSAVDANIAKQVESMKAKIAERNKADNVNITFEVVDAQQNADKQISQIQNAIVKKPTVIMVDPVDVGPLGAVLQQAKSAGIKLYGFRPSPADPQGIWDAFTDEAQLEVTMKNNLTEWMQSSGTSWNVGLLYGAAAQTAQLQRCDVVKDLAKTDSKVKVAAEKIADWQLQPAQDATTNFLTGHKDLNLIVAANNQMAQGAVNAITSANKAGSVQVATYDVDPDTIKSIINGKIAFATGFEPWGIASGAMDSAVNLAEGKPTGTFTATLYKVTKDNAAEVLSQLHS